MNKRLKIVLIIGAAIIIAISATFAFLLYGEFTIDAISSASIHLFDQPVVLKTGEFNVRGLLEYQKQMIKKDAKKPVYIIRHADPEQAGYDIMTQMAPKLSTDLPVLIKPNIGGFARMKEGPDNGIIGRVTDIRFVEGIVKYLEDNGIHKIIIAESWGVADFKRVQKLFQTSGYVDLTNRHSTIKLVDLNYYGGKGPNDDISIPVRVDIPHAIDLKTGLMVPKIYLEHLRMGLVINVPKLKMHRFSVISAGMKNLMGTIGIQGNGYPHTQKWKMHAELTQYLKTRKRMDARSRREKNLEILQHFSNRLCDVYTVVRPHMTIVDGVLAASGDGFNQTTSTPLCVAIGSYNTIYADLAASKIVGYWKNKELEKHLGVNSPPYLISAIKRNYKDVVFPDEVNINDPADVLNKNLTLTLISLEKFTLHGNAYQVLSGGDTIPVYYLGTNIKDFDEFLHNWPLDKTSWITRKWNGQPLPPGVATGFLCGYTDNELFIFYIAHYRELNPLQKTSSQQEITDLFKGDVVEAFIDPHPNSPRTYYEWEYSPTGGKLDLAIDLSKSNYDTAWDSGFSGYTVLPANKNIWYSVIRIPFNEIEKPDSGDKWKANFYRVEGKRGERLYMAWHPTMTKKPNFHVPKSFGWIQFQTITSWYHSQKTFE